MIIPNVSKLLFILFDSVKVSPADFVSLTFSHPKEIFKYLV